VLRHTSFASILISVVAACSTSSGGHGVTPGDSGSPADGASDGTSASDTGSDVGTDSDTDSGPVLALDGGLDGGLPFTVASQIAFNSVSGNASAGVDELQLLNYTGACALAQKGELEQSTAYLDFSSTTGAPFAVGTFSMGAGVAITLFERDVHCQVAPPAFGALSGSLTIATLDATTVTGTFTADMPGVGTVSGSIDATVCSPVAAQGSGACIP
jgi:hypothetical protein